MSKNINLNNNRLFLSKLNHILYVNLVLKCLKNVSSFTSKLIHLNSEWML